MLTSVPSTEYVNVADVMNAVNVAVLTLLKLAQALDTSVAQLMKQAKL